MFHIICLLPYANNHGWNVPYRLVKIEAISSHVQKFIYGVTFINIIFVDITQINNFELHELNNIYLQNNYIIYKVLNSKFSALSIIHRIMVYG